MAKDIQHLDRPLKKITTAVFLLWEISLKIGDKGTCVSSYAVKRIKSN